MPVQYLINKIYPVNNPHSLKNAATTVFANILYCSSFIIGNMYSIDLRYNLDSANTCSHGIVPYIVPTLNSVAIRNHRAQIAIMEFSENSLSLIHI